MAIVIIALGVALRHHAVDTAADCGRAPGIHLGAYVRIVPRIVLAIVVAGIARRLIEGIRINRNTKADNQGNGGEEPAFAAAFFCERNRFIFHG